MNICSFLFFFPVVTVGCQIDVIMRGFFFSSACLSFIFQNVCRGVVSGILCQLGQCMLVLLHKLLGFNQGFLGLEIFKR